MFIALLATSALAAPTAFVGATIHPVSGDVIDGGVVVVDGTTLVAIGSEAEVEIPEDAVVVDVRGKVIIPGLVDTHSHIASTGDLHESGITPGVSAIDAIDPTLPSIQRAQAGGITTANIMPGSGTLVGGQTAYVKMRDVNTVDAMLLCDDRREDICGGMKMANGTNPQGGKGPDGRMGAAYQHRTAFSEARDKLDEPEAAPRKKKKHEQVGEAPDDADLDRDAMVQILEGDRIVHFHTHRADDIVTALGMADEFGFQVVLHHVSEAWKVTDVLAAHDARASLILVDSPGGKEEAVEIRAHNAVALEEAGVMVALHSDDPITDSRLFLRMGALAVRAGMTREGALKSLTLHGALMLGLEDRIGSLEVGKDADLVVLSGDPFSVWTRVEQTWVDGVRVFDRSDPDDRRTAVGGLHPELP